MSRETDARVVATELYFLPVETRVPYAFGRETLTEVTVARAKVTVRGRDGSTAVGWGETPLSAAWAWPGTLPYTTRDTAMRACCERLAEAWVDFDAWGHPLEVGDDFRRTGLDDVASDGDITMPYLAALVCVSVFDQALHDAYGHLQGVPIYRTYNRDYMSRDLAAFLTPADDTDRGFAGTYPSDFLTSRPESVLPVWHSVGAGDPLTDADRTGDEPDDGYPVTLAEWVRADSLDCLKIKLRGTDAEWDTRRIVGVDTVAGGQASLCADFNCTAPDPDYVIDILDRLRTDRPDVFDRLLYIEQPFAYDLRADRFDVTAIAARKPLFLDESAHDWTHIAFGHSLGWDGVALKTCKTQTGAILSLCWAKAHGMPVMVQDLTNPMLAMIPHATLAAYAGTLRGLESNAPQFYPEASRPEAAVHPGLYRRRDGMIDLSTLSGPGFGMRVEEIGRVLPDAAVSFSV
ncbi:MAG: mandelate racemase/muconate lactonizing enzyme family protein [Planctomycetota bacterium]